MSSSALLLRATVVVAAAMAVPATAQPYPAKPVRLIVPYPAGGGTDIIGRVFAGSLSTRFGQQVIVDNRAGGGTIVGTDIAAKAPADGYTLLMTTTAVAINPGLHPHVPYDLLRDFVPIMQVALVHSVLVVHPAVAATSVRELVEVARTRQGGLSFGSSGTGTIGHLAGELFAGVAGVRMTHVPYRGGAPLLTDLIGGQIQFTFASLPSAVPFIRAGRVRALAMASPRRALAMPEVPTVGESGFPGFEATNWQGLFAPARTPASAIERVHAAMRAALAEPEVLRQLAVNSFEPIGSTSAEFAAVLRVELPKWVKVIKESGARAD